MSIWRAPLLILSILFILLAAAALAAPWFVDWNRYRPRIEAWGSALLGRAVTIGGDVDLVLFPWPAARLRDVRVANTKEGGAPYLLRVAELDARFSLAALFSGRLEVESIRLLRPRLTLEHFGRGRGNWEIRTGGTLKLPFGPERISIDNVQVTQGRVALRDARLKGRLVVDAIEAVIRAPRLTGPWRLKGRARALGRDWRLRFSTGVIAPGREVTVSLRMMPPKKASGFALNVDGVVKSEGETPRFEGRLALAPVVAAGRSDPLDPARQVEVSAAVTLTPARFDLEKLKIVPRFPNAGFFDTVEGAARLHLTPAPRAWLRLRTPRLAVDAALARLGGKRSVAGRPSLRQQLRMLAAGLKRLPEGVPLTVELSAASVAYGEGQFSGLRLSAEATRRLLSIRELRVEGPHDARIAFEGSLTGGDHPDLAGELRLETADARGLLFALSDGWRRVLSGLWRGAAGRLAMRAGIDVTEKAVRLLGREMTLDGAAMTLDWRRFSGADGVANEARLSMARLDLDAYAGRAGLAPGEPDAMLDRLAAAGRWRVALTADEVRLAGRRGRGLRLAFATGGKALKLERLDLADLQGLKVRGSATFTRAAGDGRRWQGRLQAHVRGERAAAIWRTFGPAVSAGKKPPAWLARAGKTALDAMLHLGPALSEAGGRKLELLLNGRLGPARLMLSADGRAGDAPFRQGEWRVRADVSSEEAAGLLALIGLSPQIGAGAAQLHARLDGVPARGMKTRARVRLPGLEARYDGTLALAGEAGPLPLRGGGELALKVRNAAPWMREIGLRAPPALPLSGKARVAFSPRRLTLERMAFDAGGASVAGSLALRWPEPGATAVEERRKTISGRLLTSRLDLKALFALLFAEPGEGARLRAEPAAGWDVDMVLEADEARLFAGGWRLGKARLRLRPADGGVAADLSAGGGESGLTAKATFRREALGLTARGALTLSLPAAAVLKTADGRVRGEGTLALSVTGGGRAATLKGFAPALKGKGELRWRRGRLRGLSPRKLLRALRTLKDEKALEKFDEIVRRTLHAGTLTLPEEVRAAVEVSDGLVQVGPVTLKARGLETRLSALFALTDGKLDVSFRFADEETQAPPFVVALAGVPGALAVAYEAAPLREWTQQLLLQRKMKRLEELERRRQALEKEAKALEERARLEEQRRLRERMLQQADEINHRLRALLREVGRDDRGWGGDAAGAVGGGKTIEALIRQAREEESSGEVGAAASAKPVSPSPVAETARKPGPSAGAPMRKAAKRSPPKVGEPPKASGKGPQQRAKTKRPGGPIPLLRPSSPGGVVGSGKVASAPARSERAAAGAGGGVSDGARSATEKRRHNFHSRPLIDWDRLAPAGP